MHAQVLSGLRPLRLIERNLEYILANTDVVLYQREEENQDACSYDPEKPQCVDRDKRHVTVKGRSPEEIWSTNQIWGCYSRLSRAELAREPSRACFGHDLGDVFLLESRSSASTFSVIIA